MASLTLRQRQVIEQNILNHFSNHSADEITPDEWKECVIKITNSMVSEIEDIRDLSADLAQLENKCMLDIEKAINDTKKSVIENNIVSFESFCNREGLGEADKRDIPGVMRAIEILKKELT